jgi:hypothetical protein
LTTQARDCFGPNRMTDFSFPLQFPLFRRAAPFIPFCDGQHYTQKFSELNGRNGAPPISAGPRLPTVTKSNPHWSPLYCSHCQIPRDISKAAIEIDGGLPKMFDGISSSQTPVSRDRANSSQPSCMPHCRQEESNLLTQWSRNSFSQVDSQRKESSAQFPCHGRPVSQG